MAAIVINRAPWTALVDDSGQNLDGSIWNKAAIKGVLLDPIDAALAQAPNLSTPNTWAGGVQTFTNDMTLAVNGNGGLAIVTTSVAAAAYLELYTGNTRRVRILPTGEVLINRLDTLTGQLAILTDQTHTGIVIQNSQVANGLSMLAFVNSVGGLAGAITQTGATTVAYGTTSDARLKADAGPATDLTALRAVVIHDFAWRADGVRDRGVFAQEAHAHYPRAIIAGTDERTADGSLARPWLTDYSQFVPDLIVGWQQHAVAIAELRAALAARAA
jgi:hypothetical protein